MIKIKKGDGVFVIVILVFIIIYGFLNYFVLDTYFNLFMFGEHTFFYILLTICILSYLVASALESHRDTIFRRITYIASVMWMGILFISFIVLIIYLLINNLIHYAQWIIGLSVFVLVLIVVVYGVFNAYNIKVRHINIYTDKNWLNNETNTNGLNVVQLSDIHIGPVNSDNYLKKIVDKVNKINPDIVLITGDMVDGRYHYSKKTFNILNNVNAPIYFVGGNHESYYGIDEMKDLLSETKIKWLHDELVTFKGVNIIGLDYDSTANSNDNLFSKFHFNKDTIQQDSVGSLLYGLNYKHNFNKTYTVLMTHKPTGWKDASKYVDLMIAGHTHKGQIWPMNYLTWLDGHAIYGVYRVTSNPKFMLYVTSGTGTWGPPMRLGSHTEIVVFNIKKIS